MKQLYTPAFIIFMILAAGARPCVAQHLLKKKITISVSGQPISQVLTSMEKQGDFFFSYNSNLFNPDSLVTLRSQNQTVSDVLHSLFHNRFQYREQNNHLIIYRTSDRNALQINGKITDRVTGDPVAYATVYEKNQLLAAMTDEHGRFRLSLKKRTGTDSVSVSRVSYADTTIALLPGEAEDVNIRIRGINKPLDSVVISMMTQRDWLMRSILSSRQIINSVNLEHFFAKQPIQFSILPGIGSHGKMSSQLVNKFSFSLLGGYNGGVNGFELAGLYNITNKNARYFQAAGLFNRVGGHAEGFQLAGLFNKDSSMQGFQAAGLYNKNIKARGFQLAGLVNKNDTMQGFQAAAVNLNRKFKGVQIGVVNVADTIEGIPIGLINIGRSGVNQLALSSNEMGFLLLSYKSGNPKFYNIVVGGSRLNYTEKAFSIGYGFGKRINAGRKISLNPELTSLFFFNGNRAKQNISARLQCNFQVNLTPSLSLFTGPAVTALYSKPGAVPNGYKADLSNGAHNFTVAKNTVGWFGWNVGINLF